MFCPKCGNEIKENTKFCPKCGNELVNTHKSKQQNRNTITNTKISKQTIGLIVGIALIGFGLLCTSCGMLEGIVTAGIGAVIIFYTKEK